jgi:cadmium resistance protein CadD (predicted permease)
LVQLSKILIAAVVAFAAANIDDLLVLLLFFADRRFRSWEVVAGQYLGVSAVIGLCLAGAAAASYLPAMVIRALGVVPIVVGIHRMVTKPNHEESEKLPLGVANWTNVFAIAGISFAGCSDNLAIFTPLFARLERPEKTIVTLAFLALIGVWCWSALYLTRHPVVGEKIRVIGDAVAPWALIILGVLILCW